MAKLFKKPVPAPPIHPHYRYMMVPVLAGMEDEHTGSPNYREFLERQPPEI
jgi:hypothetical protein